MNASIHLSYLMNDSSRDQPTDTAGMEEKVSLTEALRTGALDVFGLLYDEHAVRLYAYCRTMVGDEAADAVRDAFVAAARNPGTLPDDEALSVWMFTLARRECVRRGALTRRAPADPSAEPMWRALTRLRPEHREVLALSATLETRDIARVLGVAPDTAELLAQMSRRRLEQAAISVLSRGTVRDDDMLTALDSRGLHGLVSGASEPPARLRDHVLVACAAAGRAADGALLFDEDGMPVSLDSVFDTTEAIEAISHPGSGVREENVITLASPKESFLSRRRDGLVETLGVAACAAAAAGVIAMWPAPGSDGASNMDGTSVLVHRGTPAGRTLEPSPAAPREKTAPPAAGSSAATPPKAAPAQQAAPSHSKKPTATVRPTLTQPPTPSPTPTPTPRPILSISLPGMP